MGFILHHQENSMHTNGAVTPPGGKDEFCRTQFLSNKSPWLAEGRLSNGDEVQVSVYVCDRQNKMMLAGAAQSDGQKVLTAPKETQCWWPFMTRLWAAMGLPEVLEQKK